MTPKAKALDCLTCINRARERNGEKPLTLSIQQPGDGARIRIEWELGEKGNREQSEAISPPRSNRSPTWTTWGEVYAYLSAIYDIAQGSLKP